MKQRHQNISAYVLHARKYRETSLLVEFFTAELGRCSAVAKGVYAGKTPKRNLLQPFVPLCVSLQGSTELLSLTTVEMQGAPNFYMGDILTCGLYLNEIITHTLHRYDPHAQLFLAYQQALSELNQSHAAQALREFELTLLEELGYGIHFPAAYQDEKYLDFEAGRGFVPAFNNVDRGNLFSSEIIHKILLRQWDDAEVLRAAKRLTRMALAPLLAGKTIHSRELLKK